MIFFDHNATTKISAKALEKMLEVYALPLNSSSIHGFGRMANKFADEARDEIKKLLNAQNYEVIFTSGATESNNIILAGCRVKTLIYSALEHSSVTNFTNEKIEVAVLANGLIDLSDLQEKLSHFDITLENKKIRGTTSEGWADDGGAIATNEISGIDGGFLFSLTIANNEVGTIQPVIEAAKLTHQKGGFFHCDLSQGVGKIDIDLEKINADFASLSAHKFGGPAGVGAILVRKGIDLKPLIVGGGQEKSKRAGTLNIAGISGLGVACKLGKERIANYQKTKILRDFLEEELKKIAGVDVKIFAAESPRLPNTSYFALKNCDAHTQLINFDLNQICVSSGSACSSGSVSTSKVLLAMHVDKTFLNGAIRVSLGVENTKDEIEKFISVFKEFYQRTKK